MFSKIPPSLPSGKDKTITFHRFPHHIADDPNYSLQEAYVLCRIWSFENSTPPLRCYLSYDQWATFLRCHRRQAIRIMNGLVEKKCLHKDSRGLETNIWRLASHLHHPSRDSDTQSPLNGTSDTQSPLLVTTCHHHSDTQSPLLVTHSHPRRSLEDHKEDHLEDQVVAAAPLPTEPLLKNPLIDLEPVKEPLETLEEPETFGVTQPPQVSPPPLPKKKKASSRKTSFPSPEFWAAATPKLIEWAIDNGADDSAVARWVQEKIIDMGDSAAANGYQFIDWIAAFRKWYRRDLPKGSGPEADIRKATVWLWNHTHGERMEKPPASPVVVTAVRKTLEQLGKTYLTALGETEEKWRELKLKELRQMIHDNLEAAQ